MATELILEGNQIIPLAAATTGATSELLGASLDLAGDGQPVDQAVIFTEVAVANAGNNVRLQGSNDNTNWSDIAGSRRVVTAANQTIAHEIVNPRFRYFRQAFVRAGASTAVGEQKAIKRCKSAPVSQRAAVITVTMGPDAEAGTA